MNNIPLTAAEIEARLDEALDAVLSSRRTAAGLARALEPFERAQQDFALTWVDIIAKTNAEMAFQFAAHVPEAFRFMALPAVEDWVIRAMDVYDKQGLYPGCAVFHNVQSFAAEVRDAARAVAFDEVAEVLRLFVRGLSGRPLKLETAQEAPYTDTVTLFLPPRLARFESREDNFRLYKAIAAHLWAQCWYGSFRRHGERPLLSATLAGYDDPDKARRLFHALETVRLDARLRDELPGLYRDMTALQERCGGRHYPAAWRLVVRGLQRPEATVLDTLAALAQLYGDEVPPPLCYQGALDPERAETAMHERLEREKEQFRAVLAHLREELVGQRTEDALCNGGEGFRVQRHPDPERPEQFVFTITLDGKPVALPADVRALMGSIVQDLGEIPDEYLVAAGSGGYHVPRDEKRPEDVWKGVYHEEGAFLYNEWDFRRAHYRKDWCVLREIDVHPSDEPFVERTLQRYAGVLRGLRRTFEALRGEDRLARKQSHGDDVDLDALVEAHADARTGREMTERLYVKRHKLERNIAVMFMVDMSGSTKGWINDAERESLVLLAEALEILGDRYAIYGFSGMTRKRCELYRIKRFDEPYSEAVRRRIAGVKPQDYTRMGVAVRHLTRLLEEVEARTKLLIALSDGKPDDYDGYRGEYGIEDTRMSLIEAKRAGIHPFCITIDTEAREYLPHMYGVVNWTLVDDVKKLPVKVSDIYRRLTL